MREFERAAPDRPRLLYLTQELPIAGDAGHKIRSRQLLRAFAQAFDATIAGFVEDASAAPGQILGCEVVAEPAGIRIRRQPHRLLPAVLRSLVSGRPYSLGKFDNPGMAQRLCAHALTKPPAIVVANLAMAVYLDLFPAASIIIDSHNVEAALWRDFVEAAPTLARSFVRREARLLERVERAAWARARGVVAICAEDADAIGTYASRTPVLVAPPALEQTPRVAAPHGPRADVGMLGVWSWAPNEHALTLFAGQIAPRMRAAGASMRVTGPGVAPLLRRRLERLGVDVMGAIPEVGDFYGSVDQVVAPYVQGGGVRLKMLEAVAYGVPVVGTPLAFRGILGRDAAVEDICADTSSLVDRLLVKRADIAAARRRAAELREDVLAAHDADRIAAALNAFLTKSLPSA